MNGRAVAALYSAKSQVPQAAIPGCLVLLPSYFLVCGGNAPAAQGGCADKGYVAGDHPSGTRPAFS